MEVEGTYSGAGGAAPVTGHKMAALVLDASGHALTVKIVGPAAVVDRELDNFDRLRRSIRFREASAAGGRLLNSRPLSS